MAGSHASSGAAPGMIMARAAAGCRWTSSCCASRHALLSAILSCTAPLLPPVLKGTWLGTKGGRERERGANALG